MSARSWVRVFAETGRAEAALMSAAAEHGFVDAAGFITFSTLIDWCEPGASLQYRPAEPLTVQCVVGRLALQSVDAFGEWARTPSFATAAVKTIAHLEERLVTATELQRASQKLPASTRQRVFAIAELWKQLDADLAGLKLFHQPRAFSLAAERLKRWAPVQLTRCSRLTVTAGTELTPARVAFLEQLARQCQANGCEFELVLPSAEHAVIDLPLSEALQTIEKHWAELNAEVTRALGTGPLHWLMPAAFTSPLETQAAPELELFTAADSQAEALAIAQQAAQLIENGTPPERIAVVHRNQPSTALLREAFDAHNVPLKVHAPTPLNETRLGTLALSLLELADGDFAVEPMCRLVESKYLPRLSSLCENPRPWVSLAAIVNGSQGAVGARSAWEVRLGALAQRLEAQNRPGAASVRQLITAVQVLLRHSSSIASSGTAETLCAAWATALDALGLGELTPAPALLPIVTQGSRDARDQATAATLTSALKSWADALKRSGLGTCSLSRREFARWAHEVFSRFEVTSRGPRSGAVSILEAKQLSGLSFDAVFILGVNEGVWPSTRPVSGLLTDEDCFAVNRAAGRLLFRSVVREGDDHSAVHEAEDRLLFHLALSSGQRVWLSRPRNDETQRALLPSSLWQRVTRTVSGVEERHDPAMAVSSLERAQNVTELKTRLVLETLSPPASRLSAVTTLSPGAMGSLQGQPWFQEAERLKRIELNRLRFFSSDAAVCDANTGLLSTDPSLQIIHRRLRFDAAHALSASQLERWANCRFQGFSKVLLGLHTDSDETEEISSRHLGTFEHRVLATVIDQLIDENAYEPFQPEKAIARLEAAIEASRETFEREAPTGHPALWSVKRQSVKERLLAFLNDPEWRHPVPESRPAHYEWAFGEPRQQADRTVELPAALEGELPIFFRGSIDRVDTLPRGQVVVDYKNQTRNKLSANKLLTESFQLAVYAYALQQTQKLPVLDAALVPTQRGSTVLLSRSLKDTNTSMEQLLAIDGPTREAMRLEAKPNLANAVHELMGTVRRGDLSARAHDCKFCDYARLCRITERALPEDPGGAS